MLLLFSSKYPKYFPEYFIINKPLPCLISLELLLISPLYALLYPSILVYLTLMLSFKGFNFLK